MSDRRLDLSAYHPPVQPGVYVFRDGRRRPIYIGKAKNLAARLSSYAQRTVPYKTLSMLAAARSLDWIVLNSEIEALLCEAAMVRQYQPRYNVLLRDDKRFPLILLTDEPFPKALKVRRVRHGHGRHFGPFRGATANHLLEILSRRFKIRRCGGPLPRRTRPCIDFDIGRCDAPCVKYVDREAYNRLVDDAARFLSGDTKTMVKELREEMRHAAAEFEFEKAAEMRDEVAALESMAEKQETEKPSRADADALAVALGATFAVGIVLERRKGVVLECHRYLFDTPIETNANEILRRTFLDHYRERDLPRLVCLPASPASDGDGAEIPRIASMLHPDNGARFHTPRRGDDASLLKLAIENAGETLRLESRDRGLDERNRALSQLGELLTLPRFPRSIEGYDISTMSGRDTVGACVRFEDALPRKAGYRLYRIRGRQDSDVGALAEILGRRANSKDPLPDLILIDGGIGQLQAARIAFENANRGAAPEFIALAKREELILTAEGEVIRLPRHAAALKLLQHIRDEAHRFGRNYHRKIRGRRSVREPRE